MRIRKSFIVLVAILLSPVAAHAYFISVDARSAVRRCPGTSEINFFAEIDGAVSVAVQANSGGCAGAASAFAEADLGARTVRTFNTSSTQGTSDAQAELFDIYFIMDVPEDIQFVDLGLSVSFDGTVESDGHVFNTGRLLGQAGQFSVDISPLTIGGTFASGGIQRFPRLLGGGFPRIDILLLIDSIQFFGTGTADFSSTASVVFDLSLFPTGATLVSQSGFTIRQASAVPEPGTLALFGLGLAGMGLMRRRRKF